LYIGAYSIVPVTYKRNPHSCHCMQKRSNTQHDPKYQLKGTSEAVTWAK
jgi:hypothetical protein